MPAWPVGPQVRRLNRVAKAVMIGACEEPLGRLGASPGGEGGGFSRTFQGVGAGRSHA